MNRTVCRFKFVVSRLFFCASVLGLCPLSFGQLSLPPLYPVNVLNFTIPFEVSESTTSHGDVELLVSKDRGRRWHSAARQPVESGKFPFRADGEGEYWFAFRRVSGSLTQFNGHPHLRVLVNTSEAIIVPPAQSSESGPITPPKPERFRPDNTPRPQPMQLTRTESSEDSEPMRSEPEMNEPEIVPERTVAAEPRQAFGPRLPGFEPSAAKGNREEEFLNDLLSGMSPFMDVQPVTVRRAVANNPVASPVASTAASAVRQPSAALSAGEITGVDLDSTEARPRPHVIVHWNAGNELWRDAQIDVLRGSTKEGPWIPIAINLPNSGEYWWFLTPEDLKPFYVAVQIRSFHGGIHLNVTQSAIEIDSKMAQFQR